MPLEGDPKRASAFPWEILSAAAHQQHSPYLSGFLQEYELFVQSTLK